VKKYVVAAAVAAFGFAGHASAADMAVKAVPAAPVPMLAPVYNWSGIYLGAAAGWQGSSIDLSNPDFGTLSYSPRHSSFALGGFGGVQHQFGQFVLGVEGGYMSGFDDTSLGATPSISIFVPGGTGTAQAKLKDIWSVGGRVGWAMDRWMPYVTGGYASGRFEFNAQNTNGSNSEHASATNSGGYLGGGIDWAVWDNLILGVEYRHYWFSSKTVSSSQSNAGTEQVTFDPSTDTVMGRVSYKFGWLGP
jgi:outer membrane immunogenic protein